jgi:antitoxin (DNA-binding transcriptional repressor) of toxin-antitoxin stability system
MTRECSVAKARQSLSRLIENLELGERITLTRRGKVVAIVFPDGNRTKFNARLFFNLKLKT